MYINFRQLAASDMTPNDLANLLAIRQKDSVMIEAMPEEDAGRYIELGWLRIKIRRDEINQQRNVFCKLYRDTGNDRRGSGNVEDYDRNVRIIFKKT